jgi:hypothetical protein
MKKSSKQALAAGSFLLAAASPALAVNIGGIELPDSTVFTAGQIYSSIPTAVGGVLSGYGKIDSINSQAVGELCTDCELTYRFTDYIVTSIAPDTITFNGGLIQVYLGTGATKDFSTTNAGGLAGDLIEATNGTLFLTLRGHPVDAAGNTFVSTGANIGTANPVAFGTGLASVDTSAGGIANDYFNGNGIAATYGGAADFQFNSSFSGVNPLYVGQGECGATGCLRGSADFSAVPIPEPETYALMLSALGVIGYVVNRRRRRA